MGKWFPSIYDRVMQPIERSSFKQIRTELVGKAKRRVLEIGSGTGINFPYYKSVSQVDAIEPNPLMSKRAMQRTTKSNFPIQSYLVTAEELPFANDTFDSVVATLVFCTIPDPVIAIQEIKRVSKPDAKLLFFEHVRMNQKWLGKVQDLLTPTWKKICDGCHLNRNTLDLLLQEDISVKKIDSHFKGLFLTIECINEK